MKKKRNQRKMNTTISGGTVQPGTRRTVWEGLQIVTSPQSMLGENRSTLNTTKGRNDEEVNGIMRKICVWPTVTISRARFWEKLRLLVGKKLWVLNCLVRVQKVTQKNEQGHRNRFDLTMQGSRTRLRKIFRLIQVGSRQWQWYCKKHTQWHKRHAAVGSNKNEVEQRKEEAEHEGESERDVNDGDRTNGEQESGTGQTGVFLRKKIYSWNLNTISSKRGELEEFLRRANVAIAALQETRRGQNGWPIRIRGYNIFEAPAHDGVQGRNGLALCVRDDLQCFEIGNVCPYSQAIQICIDSLTWIVINVYIPPTGTPTRKEALEAVKTQIGAIRDRAWRNDNRVVIMGDCNTNVKKMNSWLQRQRLEFFVLECAGNPETFCRSGRMSCLDHIIVTKEASWCMDAPFVNRLWDLSDHWPIGSSIRDMGPGTITSVTDGEGRVNFDVKKVIGKSNEIISHNYWDVLLNEDDDEDDDDVIGDHNVAETVFAKFIRVSREVAKDTDVIRKPAKTRKCHRRTYRLSRAARVAIRRRQHAYYLWVTRTAPATEGPDWELYCQLKQEAKKAKRESMRESWDRYIATGAKLHADCEYKELWAWINQLTGRKRKSQSVLHGPVYEGDAEDNVKFGKDAERIWCEYFQQLFSDVSGNSKDRDFWERRIPGEAKRPLESMSDRITWGELNWTLKALKNWKAPGIDGIPSEFYKTAAENVNGAEYNTEVPQSKLGRVLLHLCNVLFVDGIPQEWNTSALVVIHKGGDPKNMGNYRGIALINTIVKLVTTVVNRRVMRGLIDEKRLAPEQVGFRPLEECVGQACALYEILRRRIGEGKVTYVAFIDFKKAYDMVPHEAMFRKLELVGVNGYCLSFLRSLYDSGTIRLRSRDSYLSEEIDIERGERQGCPFSPTGFDVFINDLATKVKEYKGGKWGVLVPGMIRKLCILLMADDVAILASSLKGLRKQLKQVSNWAVVNEMEFGTSKCGVMAFAKDGEHEAAMDQVRGYAEFLKLRGTQIPVVETYKYLGLQFIPNLDMNAMTRGRVESGNKALQVLRPVLTCHSVPVGIRIQILKSCLVPVLTYGAELWGMSDERCMGPQRVLTKGMKLIAGITGNSTVVETLGLEFEIPNISCTAAAARGRALAKFEDSRCVIGELVLYTPRLRIRTWVTGGSSWLKSYYPEALEETSYRVRSKIVLSQSWDYRIDQVRKKSKTLQRYIKARFYQTQAFVKSAKYFYKVSRGTSYLIKIRVGAFWSGRKFVQARMLNEADWKDTCPCCLEHIEGGETLEHMFLHCVKWTPFRDTYLTPLLVTLGNVENDIERVIILCGGKGRVNNGRKARLKHWAKYHAEVHTNDFGMPDHLVEENAENEVEADRVVEWNREGNVDGELIGEIDSVAGDHIEQAEEAANVPLFVLVARYLQKVIPRRMSLMSRILITPRANAGNIGMVVMVETAAGEIPLMGLPRIVADDIDERLGQNPD